MIDLKKLRAVARDGAVIALALVSHGVSAAGELAGKASDALNELAVKVNGDGDDDGRK